MENMDSAKSALDAIETVAFKIGFKGYNVDEVDEFLERLSVEARQLQDQVAQQRQQLRQAAERIAQLDARGPQAGAPVPAPAPAASITPMPAPAPAARVGTPAVAGSEQVTQMIAMAQQFIDTAQQEAEAKARELTVSAQERAREIIAEARSRAEDEVNRLNGLKQRLSEDVEHLTRQLEGERARLTGALSELSRWIDNSLQVGERLPVLGAAPAARVAEEPRAIETPATPAPQNPATAMPTPTSDTTAPTPTIGQVLKFDAASRDDA